MKNARKNQEVLLAAVFKVYAGLKSKQIRKAKRRKAFQKSNFPQIT
jgi:hypothetical protein